MDRNEYEKTKKSMNEGKSYGTDTIPPELLRRCYRKIIMLRNGNKAVIERKTFLNSILIPSNNGDLPKIMNYRGISMSSTFNTIMIPGYVPK